MSVMAEFELFVMKGNVVDLAVGVMLGAAPGKIVDSLLQDISAKSAMCCAVTDNR